MEELESWDNRTSQMDEILNEKLEEAFHGQTAQIVVHDIAKIAHEYDPIDLAHAVTRLPASARIIVYENLPELESKIIFMINTGSNTRAAIFRELDDQEIKRLVEKMPPDEAVWVLDDMSDRRLKRVLDLLDPKTTSRIRELQRHDRQSAGRLMTDEFFAFNLNTQIGEVAKAIRDNPGVDLTRRIFVLDDAGELCGFVPGRNLIVNPHHVPIRQVMRPILHQVAPDSSRDEVVEVVERYKIPALPVVNEYNKLVGVITYEDVVEAMADIADETIASMAGTAEDFEENEPTYKRLLWRAPWLVVTLCAGLVTSTAISHFYGRTWFAFVPFFIPLITGMSGNVGIQTSTLLVRGLSTGDWTGRTRSDAILKEISIGIMIGALFGLVCAVTVFFLNFFDLHYIGENPLEVVMKVGFGILAACMTATTLGSFSPFFFARFGIDPAVASGPIVTALNDVLSTLMFFFVAFAIHSLFN